MHGEIHSPFIRKYKDYFWLLVALGVAFALFVAFALRVVLLEEMTTDKIGLNGQTARVI